jgi:hypothetical protein
VSPVSTQVTPPSFKRSSTPVSLSSRKPKSKSPFDSKLQQAFDDLKVRPQILEEDLVEAEKKNLLAERDWECGQVKYKGDHDLSTDQFVRHEELVVDLKDRLSDKKAQQTVHETQMKLPRTTYPFL